VNNVLTVTPEEPTLESKPTPGPEPVQDQQPLSNVLDESAPDETPPPADIVDETPAKDLPASMESSYDHIPEFAPPPYSAEVSSAAVDGIPPTSAHALHPGDVKDVPKSTKNNQSWVAQMCSAK
jgi:hypothetical protein